MKRVKLRRCQRAETNPHPSGNHGKWANVEFLRGLGSQSGVSVVATYSGRLAVARSFLRQQQWQCSSAKLLS